VTLLPEQLVRRIHASSAQLVMVLNGGSRALAELLEIPGGSKILLEATLPYSEPALTAWLGSRPEQSCSSATARAMAVVAFGRATAHGAAEEHAAGVSCTASLMTDHPKRGSHRVRVAVQTAARTQHWSLELEKNARSRAEEERIASRMLLNAVAAACRLDQQLNLPLLDQERIEFEEVAAPKSWRDLFLGRVEAANGAEVGGTTGPTPRVILAGAFNPLHHGHRRMAEIAEATLGLPTVMEISILNVDKPALDYLEIRRRLRQFPSEQAVWLSRAPTFEGKSRLFPGAAFVVGIDTLRRIADPRYYSNDRDAMLQSLQRIAARNCRFLVFGRALGSSFIHLPDLDLPDVLRRISTEIPLEMFREDISSTALRRDGAWPQ
jgi:nicotinic acid mononucleotide adenylyltransferase